MSLSKAKVLDYAYRNAKKIVVLVCGFSVILIGVLLLVLPGPGLLIIAAGLAILALEFAWAKSFLDRVKKKAHDGWNKWNTKSS